MEKSPKDLLPFHPERFFLGVLPDSPHQIAAGDLPYQHPVIDNRQASKLVFQKYLGEIENPHGAGNGFETAGDDIGQVFFFQKPGIAGHQGLMVNLQAFFLLHDTNQFPFFVDHAVAEKAFSSQGFHRLLDGRLRVEFDKFSIHD